MIAVVAINPDRDLAHTVQRTGHKFFGISVDSEKEKDLYAVQYLKWIIQHFDDSFSYVLFLREDPLKYTTLKTNDELMDTICKTPHKLLDKTFWIPVLRCNEQGQPHHPGLPLKAWFERIFPGVKCPMVFEFPAGSQFFVPKANIVQREKIFLEALIASLEAGELDPCTLERLWFYIFAI